MTYEQITEGIRGYVTTGAGALAFEPRIGTRSWLALLHSEPRAGIEDVHCDE